MKREIKLIAVAILVWIVGGVVMGLGATGNLF